MAVMLALAAGSARGEAAGEGELIWSRGERLAGRWLGMKDGWLEWQGEALAEPVRLWLPRLSGWERSAATAATGAGAGAAMSGPWVARWGYGTVFSGEWRGLSEGKAVWTAGQVEGEFAASAGALAEVLRNGPAGPLRWSGPAGLRGLDQLNRGKESGRGWEALPGGGVETRSIDQMLGVPLELPERVRVDVWLRTTGPHPKFRLRVRRSGQAVDVETWDSSLVGRGEGAPAGMGTLFEKGWSGVLTVDFQARQAVLYDLAAKELGRWQVRGPWKAPKAKATGKPGGGGLFGALAGALAGGLKAQAEAQVRAMNEPGGQGQPPDVDPGLTLVNVGESLALERLLVREWDGQPPQARPRTGAYMEKLDGTVVAGAVTALVEGRVRQAGGQETRLEEVASIRGAAEAKPQPVQPPAGVTAAMTARFQDGSFFLGEWVGATSEVLVMRQAELGGEWRLRRAAAAGLAGLRWFVPEPLAGPPWAGVEHWDQWQRGETGPRVLGRWEPAAGSVPQWRLDGADRAVPLRLGEETWSLQRAVPEPPPAGAAKGEPERLPGLAHLRSGQMVPAQLAGWREDQVWVQPLLGEDRAAARTLPLAAVGAFETPAPGLVARGFADAGWMRLRGPAKGAEVSKDRQGVTIQPGAVWAHGALLQGTRFEFDLSSSQSYNALRLRVFCRGVDEKSPHVPVLIARSGNTVYCGVEDERRPGQIRGNYHRLPGTYNKPASVSLRWTPRQLEVVVNGMTAFREPLTEKNRSGAGLVLEPAGLWGNTVVDAMLTKAVLRAYAGARARPPVELESKGWALQVPRRWVEDPPRQVLVARNGDLLRGTIEGLVGGAVLLRSGLERWEVPLDRVAAVVTPGQKAVGDGTVESKAKPTPEPETGPEPAETAKTKAKAKAGSEGADGSLWVGTRQGARLKLKVASLGPEWLEGESPELGRCRLAAADVVSLGTDAPEGGGAAGGYTDWVFEPAPTPVLPEGGTGGGGSRLQGQAAPELELKLLGGGHFSLAEARQKGQVVVLDFWATWCGPCLKALPETLAAVAELPADKVRFIGVNQGQGPEEVERFLKARGWQMTVALDPEQKAGRAFAVEGIPHTVVVAPDGKVVWTQTGHVEGGARALQEAVRKLLP